MKLLILQNNLINMYIKLEDVQNYFWDKAIKSRGDDTILFINIKDELSKLPTINLQDGRKKYRLIKEISTVRGVHPIGTEVFVHFNTFSGSCEIYIEDNHGPFELAYLSKSESVYDYVEEIIKKNPTKIIEDMIEDINTNALCEDYTNNVMIGVLEDALNRINQ